MKNDDLILQELLKPTLQPFMDSIIEYNSAEFILFGAPLDLTASYRSGSRFAPNAIRQESQYLESYDLRTGLDWCDVSVTDLGDINRLNDVEEALSAIESVTRLIKNSGKIPLMVGGEHTVTLGSLRALKPELILDFDAHLDLRDELFDQRLSHGTFMRRAFEELDKKVIFIGGRAFSKEEIEFTKFHLENFILIPSRELQDNRYTVFKDLKNEVATASSVYISIDMDVLDPAYAPAVGNPSANGISLSLLLDILESVLGENTLGVDITEITPYYDSGGTAIAGAYLLLQIIYGLKYARLKLRR